MTLEISNMFCLIVHVTLYNSTRRHGTETRMTMIKTSL